MDVKLLLKEQNDVVVRDAKTSSEQKSLGTETQGLVD
jgi:hypothetical protein